MNLTSEMADRKVSETSSTKVTRKTTDKSGGKKLSIFQESPKGWKLLRLRIPQILAYGRSSEAEGGVGLANLIDGVMSDSQSRTSSQNEEQNAMDQLLDVSVEDAISRDAIPFLPFWMAIGCMGANFIIPGFGTCLSGFMGMCFGIPRLRVKEAPRLVALVVNLCIGVAQFMTITFCLVGWFWSMAWGGLIVFHAIQYRQALSDLRAEQAATAALEVFTNNTVLHRSEMKSMIKNHKTTKVAPTKKSSGTPSS